MPVLATFVYPQGGRFAPQRQQINAFAVGWQPDAVALISGQYTVLEEYSFGGFRVHIRFKDWVWNWDNRGLHLDDLFEDFYATLPFDDEPISTGTAYVSWVIDETFSVPLINITLPAPAAHYYIQRFPPADRPYWCVMHDELPATPFWYP